MRVYVNEVEASIQTTMYLKLAKFGPDLILVLADEGKAVTEWLDRWRRFPQLNAVRQDGLQVDSYRLVRPTPDVLDGVAQLCKLIARQRELSRAAN